MIEWESLALGMKACDAVFKEAEVIPLVVRAVTPGRLVALFTGEVTAVEFAISAGRTVGADCLYDEVFLPKPHEGIVPAVGARSSPRDIASVGIIETSSLCAALLAADGAAKNGEIHLLEIRLGMGIGGKGLVVLTGEQSQVESALSCGQALAVSRGRHIRTVAIPNPDPRFAEFLVDPQNPFSEFLI
jgi:microcompartment protein CcmL/EutN